MAITNPESKNTVERLFDELESERLDPGNNYAPAPLYETLAGSELSTVGTDAYNYENGQTKRWSETAYVGRTAINYTVVTKEGTDLAAARRLYVTPGYIGIKSAYMPFVYNLVEEASQVYDDGIAVILTDSPRKHGAHGIHAKHVLHPELLLAQAIGGVVRDVNKKHNTPEHRPHNVMIGHSMGAPADVNSANYIAKLRGTEGQPLYQGLIDSVILLTPGGSTGEKLLQMGKNSRALIAKEIIPNRKLLQAQLAYELTGSKTRDIALEGLRYVLKNPFRTAGEGIAVSLSDIRPGLNQLQELGIGTACIAAVNDQLFRYNLVEKQLKGHVDVFTAMDTPPTAGHMAPQLFPKETARIIIETMARLAEQKTQPLKPLSKRR
jgi:pimeloyl-ACP methyl ester carboxylesterase